MGNGRALSKLPSTIGLKTRLALTYATFVGLLVILLVVISNVSINQLFMQMVKDNIAEQSNRIVMAMEDEYRTEEGSFDSDRIAILGMQYVHQGYIITVFNGKGDVVWDARASDMDQCVATINTISTLMQQQGDTNGEFASIDYPLTSGNQSIGSIRIETYGPYFYSEREATFINEFNSFLLWIGIAALVLVVGLSITLANALARPVKATAEAARQIAGGDFKARTPEGGRTRELRELATSVNDLAQSLENGDRWQKQLTSDVAHELRTPLTLLQGNLEAIRDGVYEPTTERIASCHEEVLRLSRLATDLGQVSLLERENLTLVRRDFDMSMLLEDVVDSFRHEADSRGLSLTLQAQPAQVHADLDRIRQVFVNLLSNAFAYTRDGSISVTATKEGGRFRITVSDTGCGIAPEDLPHIFDRFYRTDKSRARKTGGSGIGLAVARAIVQAHQGTITAESTWGAGTSLIVFLPL